jgi:ligand-binding sensor domain-containing protein/serine phosphatase RsbU (regulator of sigma subunit)
MKKLFKTALLVLLLWLIAPFAKAQTYNFQTYSVKQGLPSSQILSIYQDNLGFMWFGTHGGGVCKFDGKKFITYTANDSLASNYVYSISQDNEGHMLFGTDNGLSVFNGRTFRNFRTNQGLPHNRVWKVFKDKKGKIWIGTKKGPCYIENGLIKSLPALNNDSCLQKNTIFNIYEDSKNNIWYCTRNDGIISIQKNKLVKINTQNGLSMNAVFCLNEDINKNLVIGTFKSIDLVNENYFAKPIIDSIVGSSITITGIINDDFNNYWITTPSGLFYTLNNFKNFTRILPKNGLPSLSLTCIFKDLEGNLWIGTDGSGVVKFSSLKFINYNKKDSIPEDKINTVSLNRGNIIAGTNSGGVEFNSTKKYLKQFRHNPSNLKLNQVIGSKIFSIESDSNNIYFGTQNGFSVYDGKKYINYDTTSGLKDLITRHIKVIDKNKVIITNKRGLDLYENGIIVKDFDPNGEITNVDVWDIEQEGKDIVWLATDNGLVRYNFKTKEIKKFGAKEGLEDGYIRSVAIDHKNNLWITTPNGLYWYNRKTFKKFGENEGLKNNSNIYSITFDKRGYLYLGNGKGLDRLDLNTFYTNYKLSIKSYTDQDGFIGDECNLNASALDESGKLWLGTVKGVTVFDIKWDRYNLKAPATHITDIRLDFEKFNYDLFSSEFDSINQLPLNLTLPYNKNHLTFDFVGLSYTNPDVVVYQYKLEGLEDKWSPLTSKTEATYPSLPPGTYTFKVKARNNDGEWNHIPAEFSFTITPPFWKTPWFIVLMIIAGSFAIYGFIKYRIKKLEESKLILEEQVQERTKELREEKEKVEKINLEVIEQKNIIEEKNKDITDSINYAKRIQLAVLPAQSLIDSGFKNNFIFYRPKDIVSGDFYWYAEKEGKCFIAAADCTGHGVPGAFMSMIGTNLLNQSVIEKGIVEPGKILTAINNGLKEAFSISELRFDTKDGMDIALCAYDSNKNTLEYAGANRPLYFIRNGILEEVKATKNPIGAQTPSDFPFVTHSFDIQNKDVFYLTSDGYADQFGGNDGKKFMTKKLKELFVDIHAKSMVDQKNIIENTILNWMKGYEQIDDELVIGIKF